MADNMDVVKTERNAGMEITSATVNLDGFDFDYDYYATLPERPIPASLLVSQEPTRRSSFGDPSIEHSPLEPSPLTLFSATHPSNPSRQELSAGDDKISLPPANNITSTQRQQGPCQSSVLPPALMDATVARQNKTGQHARDGVRRNQQRQAEKAPKRWMRTYCVCGVSFARPWDLKRHVDTVHRGQYSSLVGLIEAIAERVRVDGVQTPCPECGMLFSSNYTLFKHMEAVHMGR